MRRPALAAVLTLAFLAGCRRPVPEASRMVALPTDEPELPQAPGREAFYANCRMCHSTRYVTNQPRLPRKTWAAEVEKMRASFGAPIAQESTPAIVDYLVAVNGSELPSVGVPRSQRPAPIRRQPA